MDQKGTTWKWIFKWVKNEYFQIQRWKIQAVRAEKVGEKIWCHLSSFIKFRWFYASKNGLYSRRFMQGLIFLWAQSVFTWNVFWILIKSVLIISARIILVFRWRIWLEGQNITCWGIRIIFLDFTTGSFQRNLCHRLGYDIYNFVNFFLVSKSSTAVVMR